MKTEKRYLVPGDYMADPAVHVFDGKLYIYPSHDWESGIAENDNGDHFNMKDYHVYSMDDVMNGEIKDHGVVLSTEDIPWAGRQLWDCDVVCKDGKYYMYFPLKDQNDIFRIGVAVSDKPYGPFIPEANPMKGSYSIDPAVWDDGDGNYYIYFGGLWGGQLQRYRNNKALESAIFPEGEEEAIPSACCSGGISLGMASTILRASWEFHCFSCVSAAFHKVLRSAYSGGAWGGSMISVWTIPRFSA